MVSLVPLIPGIPFLGFLLLFVLGGKLSHRINAVIGVGSVALSMLLTFIVAAAFFSSPRPYDMVLWRWLAVGGEVAEVSFRLDGLSLVMILVVTVVGFLIHLYSAEFMNDDAGFRRYFAYMNMFVAFMLLLVLSNNILLLYLGWEGVGLCSYLLIGFWWRDPVNGSAARKAFIVTRCGDAAFAVSIFLLFVNLETLDVQALMRRASDNWHVNSAVSVTATTLFLVAAIGKSAQVPLQVWLPDAMVGPSPVSALIHAATMVTAGVYLIARLHVLFEIAQSVRLVVALIGCVTIVVASFSALCQTDIKRILAYSTISQIGYMFLALGVGAWIAAIFHFMTHAFFKALLFLAAGVIIERLGGEHDIFRMGGLRRSLPLAFWSFLAGAASLAALPFFTAGFYSKDMILVSAWSINAWGPAFWAAGVFGAFLTALYIFRSVFVVFFGNTRTAPTGHSGKLVAVPLVILSILSLIAGFTEFPVTQNGSLSHVLENALPPFFVRPELQRASTLASAVAALLGVLVAYLTFGLQPSLIQTIIGSALGRLLARFWAAGWGFDWLYDIIFVRPFLAFAELNKTDLVDAFFTGAARVSGRAYLLFSRSQTGLVRWYAAGVAAGAALAIAIMVFT